MRHRRFIAVFAVVGSAVVAAGVGAGAAGSARAATVAAPSSVSLPITSYYQMAVDSADNRVFISQGASGGDSIVVTDFSGDVVGSIAEPSPVEGIALSPDGSTLYAALVGSTTVSPAISVISTSSLSQTTTFPLPASDTPQDVAVQSGKLWVSYGTGAYGKAAIGDFDLSAASPTLATQSAMGGWYSAPLLAADPTGTGNELVAAQPNIPSPLVNTYNTSTATVVGSGQPCITDQYDYAVDVAVVPGGAGLILACDSPQAGDEYRYSTSDLAEDSPVYGTVGTPNAIAIASSTGLVAVGGADVPQIADVYTAGGKQTNQYMAVGNGGSLADRGLGLNADGTELFAVTIAWSDAIMDYSLNVYPDPGITPTSVTLSAKPANVTVGKTVAVAGTLLIGGYGPSNTSIKITRTGGGQPATTFTADVRFAGEFTWIDSPPPGTYTYTANYPATATSAASSASAKVTVVKEAPSFSLTVTPATASYGAAVNFDARFDAVLQGNPAIGVVSVYAQTAGSKTKTKIASGRVSGISRVSGTAHFDKSTTLYAVYPGNSDNTAVTVTKTVNVGAKVTASIGGYYATKSGYRLYHHTARLKLSAAVAPVKRGECAEFQVQEYVKKAWRAVVTTGCATLSAKSEASDALVVSKYAQGVPYRVRADYIRGKDTSNLDADSGFLDFMVKR